MEMIWRNNRVGIRIRGYIENEESEGKVSNPIQIKRAVSYFFKCEAICSRG